MREKVNRMSGRWITAWLVVLACTGQGAWV